MKKVAADARIYCAINPFHSIFGSLQAFLMQKNQDFNRKQTVAAALRNHQPAIRTHSLCSAALAFHDSLVRNARS